MRRIEVDLAPGYKTLMLLLAVFTCGVGWLALWATARSWPRVVDEHGITTRAGKHDEFTESIKRSRTNVKTHRFALGCVEYTAK